jgi:MFS family permease
VTATANPAARPIDDAPVHVNPRARFEIFGAVMLVLFLAALDQTIVGPALPRILTDLGGNDLYTWVVTVYLLTSTVTGPLYGKLSDQFGRRLVRCSRSAWRSSAISSVHESVAATRDSSAPCSRLP